LAQLVQGFADDLELSLDRRPEEVIGRVVGPRPSGDSAFGSTRSTGRPSSASNASLSPKYASKRDIPACGTQFDTG
jgi:hypothetical protein